MSQAASAVSNYYAPSYGGVSPMPVPAARSETAVSPVVLVGAAVAIVGVFLIFKNQK